MKTISQDNEIMKLLHTSEVRRVICNTNKGVLELVIRKGENRYFLTLDSVPLDKETNKELMDLLFKPEIPQVKKEEKVFTDTFADYTNTLKDKVFEPITKKKSNGKNTKN